MKRRELPCASSPAFDEATARHARRPVLEDLAGIQQDSIHVPHDGLPESMSEDFSDGRRIGSVRIVNPFGG